MSTVLRSRRQPARVARPTDPAAAVSSDRPAIELASTNHVPPAGPTIYEAIAEACERFAHQDDDAVAGQAMITVGLPTEHRPALRPLVVDEVARERRRRALAAEKAAFAAGPRPAPSGRAVNVTGGGFEPDVARLRLLLAERFALGDGTEATWGAATAAQHRQRIELLARHERGLAETRGRHETALALIGATGTACLDDALEAWGRP